MGQDADNLGNALLTLGERESGTAKLEEAVSAYREALKEMYARAGSARMGDDAEQSRHCALQARRARERDGEARRGGFGLSRGAEGMDARARPARLGEDADQSRQCALEPRRARERDGASSRRRFRPIARR